MRFIIIFLCSFFLLVKSFAETEKTIYEKIDLFSEVLNEINKEYVEEINQNDVMDAAINGVLQSLDPYSAYMSPEMYKEMQTETSGKFGGLGIEVGMEHGVVKVISPIDNTPASKAGVKAGDYILLRAEMDLITILSSCPMDIALTNGLNGIPHEVEYQII